MKRIKRDIEPFEHGDEGTHYACKKQIQKYGEKTQCCGCTKHKCDPDLDLDDDAE